MSGSRFLKIQLPFLAALILLAACKGSSGVSAEPLKAASAEASVASSSSPAKPADDTHVVINIPSRTLWVYSGDRIVRYFPVGVGRIGYMTPLGKFSIIRKVVDPGWENPYLPSGKVRLAPGEDNPLGTRWMGFYQKDGGEYGMHGTDNPASVGKFSSHGCVRLKVPDAEALFDLVDVGTPVDIVYQPVLIRRLGDSVRVIVYADRFKRGMPSLAQVKADIMKQYPGAELDMNRLKAALQTPAERPVDVGILSDAEQTSQPMATQLPILQTPAAQANADPIKFAPTKLDLAKPSPIGTEIQGTEPQKSPMREPADSNPLPLNPQRFFQSETSGL